VEVGQGATADGKIPVGSVILECRGINALPQPYELKELVSLIIHAYAGYEECCGHYGAWQEDLPGTW
jgi:hypothetical protein